MTQSIREIMTSNPKTVEAGRAVGELELGAVGQDDVHARTSFTAGRG